MCSLGTSEVPVIDIIKKIANEPDDNNLKVILDKEDILRFNLLGPVNRTTLWFDSETKLIFLYSPYPENFRNNKEFKRILKYEILNLDPNCETINFKDKNFLNLSKQNLEIEKQRDDLVFASRTNCFYFHVKNPKNNEDLAKEYYDDLIEKNKVDSSFVNYSELISKFSEMQNNLNVKIERLIQEVNNFQKKDLKMFSTEELVNKLTLLSEELNQRIKSINKSN